MDTREKIKAKIAELQAALRTIEWVESEEEKHHSNGMKATATGSRHPAGGFRPARNPGGSWADAVGAVLEAGKAMTVMEIVEALRQQGRVFGESRPDAIIRSVIFRRAKALGWHLVPGSNPKKWKKSPS